MIETQNETQARPMMGSADAAGSPAVERARMHLFCAACQYACAHGMAARIERPETREELAKITWERLDELADAARDYFRAVCSEPENTEVLAAPATNSTPQNDAKS